MQEEKQKRLERRPSKGSFNPWKWAFTILLALILAGGLFIFYRTSTPNAVQRQNSTESTASSNTKYSMIDVAVNKKQLSAAINYYLQKNTTKTGIKYRFVMDKSAILVGTTKILGKNVSFSLYSKPYLDSDGNIALKAKSVAVGSLNAPPSFILKYVKNNYDLGKWVAIDTKASTITLKLNQIPSLNGMKIRGERLDLAKNDLKFKVEIPLK